MYLRENLYSPVFKGAGSAFSVLRKCLGHSTHCGLLPTCAHTYISWEYMEVRPVLSIPYLIIHFLFKNNRFGLEGWRERKEGRSDGGKDRVRQGEREGEGKERGREGGSDAGGEREGRKRGREGGSRRSSVITLNNAQNWYHKISNKNPNKYTLS